LSRRLGTGSGFIYTLEMKFLRAIFFVFLGALFFSLFSAPIYAEGEFSIDANVTYNVSESGKTQVTHDLTLTNNFSTLYAANYKLGLENIDFSNIQVSEEIDGSRTALPFEAQKEGDLTNIFITFPKAAVGKGVQRHFIISYDNSGIVTRTGEVWEVSIPRLDGQAIFRKYDITLHIPASFGLEAYISPKPKISESNSSTRTYTFSKEDVSQAGITAGFGQFQVFAFNLSYHLENPLITSSKTQIAIPPDTAFQRVYVQNINPKPSNVVLDNDGNWLATYKLSGRERMDVNVTGAVQIFAGFRPFLRPSDTVLSNNLKGTEYWQVEDPQIKALAAKLKTPRAIYDYVSTTLNYDSGNVQPNTRRKGAVAALENPNNSICMEFTDLFIAIARAAGIPAREINGFAYTENPQLQPLGMVADVLHSWPEYYDMDRHVWIPIDPTWAATSGGVDYFDKLDLRHFTFVVHGESATNPSPPGSYKLGPNPQKDVFVSFGKLPDERNSDPSITITPVRSLPFLTSVYSAVVSNHGPIALYDIHPTVYFDGKEQAQNSIEALPPFSNFQMRINIPHTLLGGGTPSMLEVRAGNRAAKIPTNKNQVIITSLLTISVFLIVIVVLLLIRLKKIRFNNISATISGFKQKIYDRFHRKAS
jgi:transglutaminase-like putative cysteine protease